MNEHSSASHGQPATFAAPPIGLRELLEAAPDVVFCCDAEGRWMWLNEAVVSVTGFKPRDLLGHRCTGLIAPHERRPLVRAFVKLRRSLEEGRTQEEAVVRLHVMTAEGSEAPIEARVRSRMTDRGEMVFVGVARAVTEAGLAAETAGPVDAAEKPAPVDNAPEPGVVDGEALEPSAMRRKAPHSRRQLAQDVLFELTQPGLADSVRSEGAPDAVAPPGAPSDGAGEGMSSEKLTEMKAQLEQLAAEVEEEREAASAKMELLATMSHEIRTPMNGIMGMTHLLLETGLDDGQRGMVDVIRSSSRALLSLINDTLDFSKLDAGRLEIEEIDFDLRVTVEEVAALLRPLTRDKGLELDCRVHHDVPSRLKGDPGRLRQVLINFGGNAIKFTEEGSVSIHVERVSEQGDVVTLRFTVSDTGIGIAESKLPGLFQSFAQGDPSIARRFGGTGLGLAVSRRLVELMGGEVGARSEPGKGSTFWFTLPLAMRREDAVAEESDGNGLQGLRVLVVDQDQRMREPIVEKLRGWGADVEGAMTGGQAIERLRAAVEAGTPFQIALIEMQVPDMSGEELGAAIRADETFSATRLAMVTSVGRKGDAARIHALGFSAYLMKPVPWPELRDAMLMLKRRNGSETAGESLITRHSIAEARRGRLRILLVEDNPVNQLVAQWALRRNGYGLDVVTCATDAFKSWEKQSYDLILMDIHMPDMNGYDATRELRKREEGRGTRTPIVAMTANDSSGERERCVAAGMDDYLAKPVDLSVLSEIVDRYTQQSQRARLASESGTPIEEAGQERGADRGPAPTTGNTAPEELRRMLESEAAAAIGFGPRPSRRPKSAGIVRRVAGVARITTAEGTVQEESSVPSGPLVEGGNAYAPPPLKSGDMSIPVVKRVPAASKQGESARGSLQSGYGDWLHDTGKDAQSPEHTKKVARKSRSKSEAPTDATRQEAVAASEPAAAEPATGNEPAAAAEAAPVTGAEPPDVEVPPAAEDTPAPKADAPDMATDKEKPKQNFPAAVMKLLKREVRFGLGHREPEAEAESAAPAETPGSEAFEPHDVDRSAALPVEPDPTPRDQAEIEGFEPFPAGESVAQPVESETAQDEDASDPVGFENIVIGADALAPAGSDVGSREHADPEAFEPFVLGADALAPVTPANGEDDLERFEPRPVESGAENPGFQITRSLENEPQTAAEREGGTPAQKPLAIEQSDEPEAQEAEALEGGEAAAPGAGASNEAIDRRRLDESSMGIPALRDALLQAFLSDIEPRLDRLGQAIGAGDARRVEFEAHGLKGMTATIGANACMSAFLAIESCGREQRLGDASPLLGEARRAVEEALGYIRSSGLLEAA